MIAKFDFNLASSILALVTIGLIMVASASVALESGPVSYALRHFVYVTSALCLFIFVLNIFATALIEYVFLFAIL